MSLAGIRLAAQGSGQSFQELNGALLKFAKNGEDADAALDDFIEKFFELDTATARSKFSMQELGEEAGPKLAQALGNSAEALKANIHFTRVYGADVTNAADESGRWQKLMGALDVQIKGVTASLIPFGSISDTVIEVMTAIGALGIRTAGALDMLRGAGESLAAPFIATAQVLGHLPGIMTGNIESMRAAEAAVARMNATIDDVTSGDRFEEFVRRGDESLFNWYNSIKAVTSAASGEDGSGNSEGIGIVGVKALESLEGVTLLTAGLRDMFEQDQAWQAQRSKLNQEIAEDEARIDAERAERREKDLEDAKKEAKEKTKAHIRGFLAVGQAGMDLADILVESNIIGAKKAAKIQKAAAIFQIALNTAQAVMSAMTLLPPASFIAAGLVAATGAVQAGIVATQPAPSFHTGGVVTADLLENEAVLNQRATQSIGVQAIEAMNNGESMASGPSMAVLAMNDRIMDRLVSRTLRADGRSRRELTRGPVATRAPYR